ncbi:glycosyltransferase [Vibrio artabrorum]|uniref:glycosyltransferase n=1 Tax=Vibrio artabrorum TaxID=446374 RepID=UPI003551AA61
MKILYLTSTLKKSGPTNQLFYIIKNLSEDFEPVVVTLSPEPERSLLSAYEAAGIKVVSLGLSRLAGVFLLKNKLLKVIDAENPDLIHSQGFRADVLNASLRRNQPRICTVRNFPQLDFKMTYGFMLSQYMCFKQKRILKRFDTVCGVSDAVTENLRNIFHSNNAITVHNGVDMRKYVKSDSSTILKFRGSLGIKSEQIVWITSLGKDDRKNSITLFNGIIPFLRENKQHFLIVVGDGKQKKECEKIAGNMSNVSFQGKVSNVEDYLSISDYFISASRAEGMPNAVLEALSCGLPSILSNIPPHLEIERLGKGAIFCFETEDSNSLYQRICSMTFSTKKKQSELALKTATDYFDSQVMSLKYQELYIKLFRGI